MFMGRKTCHLYLCHFNWFHPSHKWSKRNSDIAIIGKKSRVSQTTSIPNVHVTDRQSVLNTESRNAWDQKDITLWHKHTKAQHKDTQKQKHGNTNLSTWTHKNTTYTVKS